MIEELEEQRLNKNIPLPAYHYIETTYLADQKRKYFNEKIILTHFLHEGRLSNDQINTILDDSSKIFRNEKNLLEIEGPAYIIGDIHGQFFDLNELLKKFDFSKDTIIFLGDYVDRGVFSLEVYVYLLVLKINYPNNIFLLRGNHECSSLTSFFTFKEEVKFKHNSDIYNRITNSFNCLPLAAVVSKKVFCVHGGISPHLKYIEQINSIDRFKEIPYDGLMCDLMWADPATNYNIEKKYFEFNHKRRVSVVYYYSAVKKFLEENNLDSIVRGHEVEKFGYKKFKCFRENIPSVHTVFSAPNYCDTYSNLGSILYYDNGRYEIKNYEWIAHPYVNKNYIDVISQTFSFVSEKVSEFYLDLLTYLEEISSATSSSTFTIEEETTNELALISDVLDEVVLKQEINIVQEFNKNMLILREERENSDEMELEKPFLDSNKCKTIDETHYNYNTAQKKDAINEEKIEDRANIRASSIEIPPSMVCENSKKIQMIGLEKAIKKCEIKEESDKFKVKIKKD